MGLPNHSSALEQRSLDDDNKAGEEVKAKSLFEFKQNVKYLKTNDEGGKAAIPVSSSNEPKTFNFGSRAAEDADQQRGFKAPVFQTSNLFKINTGGSDSSQPKMNTPIFATG